MLKRLGSRLYSGRDKSWKIKPDVKTKTYKALFLREYCGPVCNKALLMPGNLFNYFRKGKNILINALCHSNIT